MTILRCVQFLSSLQTYFCIILLSQVNVLNNRLLAFKSLRLFCQNIIEFSFVSFLREFAFKVSICLQCFDQVQYSINKKSSFLFENNSFRFRSSFFFYFITDTKAPIGYKNWNKKLSYFQLNCNRLFSNKKT